MSNEITISIPVTEYGILKQKAMFYDKLSEKYDKVIDEEEQEREDNWQRSLELIKHIESNVYTDDIHMLHKIYISKQETLNYYPKADKFLNTYTKKWTKDAYKVLSKMFVKEKKSSVYEEHMREKWWNEMKLKH